jgi:hypothetical protein
MEAVYEEESAPRRGAGVGQVTGQAEEPSTRDTGMAGPDNWLWRVEVLSVIKADGTCEVQRRITRKCDNQEVTTILAVIKAGARVSGPGYDGPRGVRYYLLDFPSDLEEEFLAGALGLPPVGEVTAQAGEAAGAGAGASASAGAGAEAEPEQAEGTKGTSS